MPACGVAATAECQRQAAPGDGISPFGQKRHVPTTMDGSATDNQRVFVNGGQRGLQIELRPDDLVAVLAPIVAALTG